MSSTSWMPGVTAVPIGPTPCRDQRRRASRCRGRMRSSAISTPAVRGDPDGVRAPAGRPAGMGNGRHVVRVLRLAMAGQCQPSRDAECTLWRAAPSIPRWVPTRPTPIRTIVTASIQRAGGTAIYDAASLFPGWDRSIPVPDKASWRDPAVADAYGQAALASDPTSPSRAPAAFRAPLGAIEDSFYQASGRRLFDASAITAATLVVRSELDFWSRPEDADAFARDAGRARSVKLLDAARGDALRPPRAARTRACAPARRDCPAGRRPVDLSRSMVFRTAGPPRSARCSSSAPEARRSGRA